MEESKRLLAVGDQDVEPQGFGRGAGPRGGARTFWRKQICLMYLTAVHTFLLFSVLGNVYQAYQSDAYVERLTICKLLNFASSIWRTLIKDSVPEMRFLRQVIKNEHPEHGERYSNYTGRPNNDTAKAWDGLLQRKFLPFLAIANDIGNNSSKRSTSTPQLLSSRAMVSILTYLFESQMEDI